MKRKDLDKQLRPHRVERGSKHDKYFNSAGQSVPVPRHKELNEFTARAILKRAAAIGILATVFIGWALLYLP